MDTERKINTFQEKKEEFSSLASKMEKLINYLTDDNQSNYDNTTEVDVDMNNTNDNYSSTDINIQNDSISVSPNPSLASFRDNHSVLLGELVESSQYTSRLAKYDQQDVTSPAVNEDLANFVNTTLTSRLTPDQFKSLAQPYNRPVNTPMLCAPKLNREIWKLVPDTAQKQDVNAQNFQNIIIKGLCPLVQALNKLKDQPEVSSLLQDSFEILAHASMEFNFKRRAELRPFMLGAKQLSSKDVPVTTKLFGDNLESELKKIEQDKKLRDNMSVGPSGMRHNTFLLVEVALLTNLSMVLRVGRIRN